MSRKVIFNTYNQDQVSHLFPSCANLAPVNHPLRFVNTIIDHIDISAMQAKL